MIRGDRLRALRKEKGLSQEELAEILNVSKSSISCYEKETRSPSTETIIDMMHLFAVSSDYIIGCDNLIRTIDDNNSEIITLSKEEVLFLEELKKNKMIYNIILEDPKRTAELIKSKIG